MKRNQDAGGGQNDPLSTDKAFMPSIFIKTSQKLVKAVRCQLSPIQTRGQVMPQTLPLAPSGFKNLSTPLLRDAIVITLDKSLLDDKYI